MAIEKNLWGIFGVKKEDFPKIEFTNPKIEHKEFDYEFVRETVENTWNTLSNKCKTRDALLIHLTYVLGLKTWKIRLLVFEDAEYKDQPKIKIYDLKKETVKQILISQELYDKII